MLEAVEWWLYPWLPVSVAAVQGVLGQKNWCGQLNLIQPEIRWSSMAGV